MFTVKNLLCVSAFALATAAASNASAAAVWLDTAGEYNNAKITVSSPSFFANPDGDALKLVFNFGTAPGTPTFTVWGFCVDLFHFVDPGYFSQKTQTANQQYDTGALVDDSNGHTLSATQVQEIYGLAALGYTLVKNSPSPETETALQAKLSGIQGAIWRIEYPAFTIGSNDAALDAAITQYANMAPSLHGTAYALVNRAGGQDFVIGVPEPATWAMMIIGFGAVGMAMRSRRRLATAA